MSLKLRNAVVLSGLALASHMALAQTALTPAPVAPPPPNVKLDHWRWELGLGASVSSGNTEASSATFNADGVRISAHGKWTVNGRLLYAKDAKGTTAEQLAADSRYDHNVTPLVFLFGQVGGLRDRPANLDLRVTAGAGAGYHLIETPETVFDVTAGLGVARDRYTQPKVVNDQNRETLDRVELLLGENSSHRLTDTTTFKQQLALSPALDGTGLRAEWKAGLAVAMTAKLKLSVNASVRYNGDPGVGVKKTDTLLVTGVQLTLD
jgi:putative salt-induced outer membrane protein YdiY